MTSRQLGDLFSATLKELARSEYLVDDALSKLSSTASLPAAPASSASSSGNAADPTHASTRGGVQPLVTSGARIVNVLLFTSVCEQMAGKMLAGSGQPMAVAKALRKTRQSMPQLFALPSSADLYADDCNEMLQCLSLAAVAQVLERQDEASSGQELQLVMRELSALLPCSLDVARLFSSDSAVGVWSQPLPIVASLVEHCADVAQGPHQDLLFAPFTNFFATGAPNPPSCDENEAAVWRTFVSQLLLLLAAVDHVVAERRKGASIEAQARGHRFGQKVWVTLHNGLRKALLGSSSAPRRVLRSSAHVVYTAVYTPLRAVLGQGPDSSVLPLHRTGLYWLLLLVEDLAAAEKALNAGGAKSGAASGQAFANLLRQNNGQVTLPVLRSLCEERHALLEGTQLKAPTGHLLHRLTCSCEDDDAEGLERVFLLYIDKGSIFAKRTDAGGAGGSSAAYARVASLEALFGSS